MGVRASTATAPRIVVAPMVRQARPVGRGRRVGAACRSSPRMEVRMHFVGRSRARTEVASDRRGREPTATTLLTGSRPVASEPGRAGSSVFQACEMRGRKREQGLDSCAVQRRRGSEPDAAVVSACCRGATGKRAAPAWRPLARPRSRARGPSQRRVNGHARITAAAEARRPDVLRPTWRLARPMLLRRV